jgi:hypothetical protein
MKPAGEFSNQPSRLGVFRRQERPGRQTEPALDTPTFLGTAGFRAGTAIDGPTAHNLRRSPEPDRILPEHDRKSEVAGREIAGVDRIEKPLHGGEVRKGFRVRLPLRENRFAEKCFSPGIRGIR